MTSLRAYKFAGTALVAGIAACVGIAELPAMADEPVESVYTEAESTQASTGLPAPQNVQANIRGAAFQPTAAITHKIHFLVSPVGIQGSLVAWEVTDLVLHRTDAFGVPENTWSIERPDIGTPDGLWWVEHADPLLPLQEEFTVLPLAVGTAESLDPAIGDMYYELEGSTYEVPPQGSLFPITGELTYTLVAEDEPEEPESEGTEVPIEWPDVPDDPYPA